MVPEDLALQSLTADSAYCLAMGAGATVMSAKLGSRLSLPTPLVAVAGLGTMAWGGWVGLAAGSGDWRSAAKAVAAANAGSAAGLALLAATRKDRGARVGTAALASHVALFGAVQGVSLLWDRRSHIGTDPLADEPDPAGSAPGARD